MLRAYKEFSRTAERPFQIVKQVSKSGAIVTVENALGQQWDVYGEFVSAGSGNLIIQGDQVIASAPSLPIIEIEI